MLFQPGEGELDEDQGSGELPGIEEFGSSEDPESITLESDGDGTFAESLLGIELSAGEEVIIEGEQDTIEEAIPAPLTIAAIAGLVGGEALSRVPV